MKATWKVIKRWMMMDYFLARSGLDIKEFAETWCVSTKTIRRDLEMFRAMGYKAVLKVVRPGVAEGYVWRYPDGQEPMFTVTASRLAEDQEYRKREEERRARPDYDPRKREHF
jgi:predicted DNA-binding transcriptional regulator YafY